MLLDSFLLTVLLPAYPINTAEEIPEQVRISAMQEFTNPYKCSRNVNRYMNELSGKDIFRNPSNEVEPDLQHVYSDLWILSMNVGYSCHIAQDPSHNSDSKDLAAAEMLRSHIKDTSNRQLWNYYFYNTLRYRMSRHPDTRKEIRASPEYAALSDYYKHNADQDLTFSMLNLALMLQEDSILEAEKAVKALLQRTASAETPPHIRAAAQLEAFYLYDYAGETNKALSFIEAAAETLDSPLYTYARALIARKAAAAFREAHDYKKTMYYAEIYLHAMGSIPSQADNYLKALIEFSDDCLRQGNPDTAFMVLRRAEGLAQSPNADKYDAAMTYMKQGAIYARNERFGDARIYTEKGCSHFRTLNSSTDVLKELDDCELGLLDIYIRGHNGEAAQNLSKRLKNRVPSMTPSQKNLYYQKVAAIEAGHRNYREAYNLLSRVIITEESSGDIPLTCKKQSQDPESDFHESWNRNKGELFSYLSESSLFYPAATSFLIFLLLCLVLIVVHNRYRNLKKKIARLALHQDTGSAAPDKRAFLSYITELRMEYIPQQNSEKKNARPLVPEEKLIICFSIPGFAGLSVSRGSKYASQIMQIFFQALKLRFPQDRFFQVSDTEFITVEKIDSEKLINETMNTFFSLLEEVLDEIRMEFSVTAGIINYPLLLNDPYRLSSEKILEVLLTALSGAQEIKKATGSNSWVIIKPKTSTVNSFEGDARQKTIDGIIKKEIHIIKSEPGFIIDWRKLDEENKY